MLFLPLENPLSNQLVFDAYPPSWISSLDARAPLILYSFFLLIALNGRRARSESAEHVATQSAKIVDADSRTSLTLLSPSEINVDKVTVV